MGFFDFLNLLGGLALFLYGMNEMGQALENMSGSKLEKILTNLTSNPLKSVIFGALITATVQSSSATTVIVVGLVNSRILKLSQAIGVIMGANIGTTITAQILSLSGIESTNFFVQLLKPKSFAPLFAILGIVLVMSASRKKQKNMGTILVGISILFTGMFAMEGAVAPLKDSPFFSELFLTLTNPILGVLAGAVVTAVIQSSSASVGILQALSSTGQISVAAAFPIIMGQNIGTCITPILSSIGASKNAKRAAAVHLIFNLLGTIIFLVGVYGFQSIMGFSFWEDMITKSGIANFHTVFNVVITLLFLPFTKQLERLAELVVQTTKVDEEDEVGNLPVLEDRLLQTPSIAIPQLKKSLDVLATLSEKNFHRSMEIIFSYSEKYRIKIYEREKIINKLEVNLSNYIVKLTDKDLSEIESKRVTSMLHLIIEVEALADFAVKISEKAKEINEEQISFSPQANQELSVMISALEEIVNLTMEAVIQEDVQKAKTIEALEQTIDLLKETLRYKHLERLKSGQCSIENGILFLELITTMETVSDRCSNMAFAIIAQGKTMDGFDRHQYKHTMHQGKKEQFNEKFAEYKEKYYHQVK